MVPLSIAAVIVMIAFVIALALGAAIGHQILVRKSTGEATARRAFSRMSSFYNL
jgi:hypothetical protein